MLCSSSEVLGFVKAQFPAVCVAQKELSRRGVLGEKRGEEEGRYDCRSTVVLKLKVVFEGVADVVRKEELVIAAVIGRKLLEVAWSSEGVDSFLINTQAYLLLP